MAQFVNVKDLYLSIAGSLQSANKQLIDAEQENAFSYAVTDLEISVAFNEIKMSRGNIEIDISKPNSELANGKSIKFSVKLVPNVNKSE